MTEPAGKMVFFYQAGPHTPEVTVKLSPHTDLTEALEAFEGFLKAAGYSFSGEIDIVKQEGPSDAT